MKAEANAFLRAVALGGLAGGAPMLIFTLPAAVDWGRIDLLGLVLVTMPLWFAFAVTLAAAVSVGLPMTAILRHWGCETVANYGLLGALFGFLIPFLTFALAGNSLEPGLFFALPGTLAGAVAGTSWGRWRESICSIHSADFPEPPPNPIHDLIH